MISRTHTCSSGLLFAGRRPVALVRGTQTCVKLNLIDAQQKLFGDLYEVGSFGAVVWWIMHILAAKVG
ncbi:unnamed protein product [Protopolystoma xenopodis]|uniref:Uncharacterized protein n=1 Tax=Protopolystoma xenopodis TaxID=117903 RepID=A0A448X5J5_9PLAT|nr:unnamed protein product [Protopolystoma xenopodis]